MAVCTGKQKPTEERLNWNDTARTVVLLLRSVGIPGSKLNWYTEYPNVIPAFPLPLLVNSNRNSTCCFPPYPLQSFHFLLSRLLELNHARRYRVRQMLFVLPSLYQQIACRFLLWEWNGKFVQIKAKPWQQEGIFVHFENFHSVWEYE